jgi:hypothetical protein
MRLTDDEQDALKAFATLRVTVDEFLHRMRAKITVGEFRPGQREINVAAFPKESVKVTRDDIRWAVQLYLHGKTSGEELSNWAGLLLAVSAYELPVADADDDLLGLLEDLALPLKDEYLDREDLKRRLQESSVDADCT